MGSIGIAFKRFLGNKNTVTIVGIVAGIAVIWFAYNWRVSTALDLISVPIASQDIERNTHITDSMVTTARLQRAVTAQTQNLITNRQSVIGQYVRYDTSIIRGSFFHTTQLISRENLPNSMFRDLRPGRTVFSLALTGRNDTYAGFVRRGDYIDIYFSATEDNRPVFGKFITGIRVLAVKDRNGHHILPAQVDAIPAFLFFDVPDDEFMLLMTSAFVQGIQLYPIPRGVDFTGAQGEVMIASERIRDFIAANAEFVTPDIGTGNITRPEEEGM